MRVDRHIEAGNETDANCCVLEGLVPFAMLFPSGSISGAHARQNRQSLLSRTAGN
jgi:hypothetical protein